MTYNLKKESLNNWNLEQINENPIGNIEDDDDQDIYISERSSVASSTELTQVHSTISKRVATPATSSIVSIPQKQSYTHRYPYHELLETGIPIATQFQLHRKEEKPKKKDLRKVPVGQGDLVSFPETKPPELTDSYHSYLCYSKANNPNWIMRHRQTADSQTSSYETLDPSRYAHQPALITSPIKPRPQQPRKARHNNAPTTLSNQDKQRLNHSENNSTVSHHLTSHEYHANHETNYSNQRSLPRQHAPLKDCDPEEHRIQPTKRTISQQRRKLKTENGWTDHHVQSLSNGKASHDASSLMITSNALTNRPKNPSKILDKNAVLSDIDDNGKYRHHHYHSPSHYHHQNQTQTYNSPSIPSQQIQHHNHHHVRRRPPSGTNLSSDLQVVDISFKKFDRPSHIQQTRDPFHSSGSSIYSQTPHLPPIIRDHQQHKTHTPRFPNEYYGTLARQTHGKEWEDPMDVTKIYKPEPQIRFYDRYLHNIIDKRLAA